MRKILDLHQKPFGQQFIIILIRYFTGVGYKNTWTANLDYNYYILQDSDFKSTDFDFDCYLSYWIGT